MDGLQKNLQVIVNYYAEDPNLDPHFIKRLDEYEADVCECLIFSIKNSSRSMSRLIYHVDWQIGIKPSLYESARDYIILSHSVRNFHSRQEVSNYVFSIIFQHSQLPDMKTKHGLLLLSYYTFINQTISLDNRSELESYL